MSPYLFIYLKLDIYYFCTKINFNQLHKLSFIFQKFSSSEIFPYFFSLFSFFSSLFLLFFSSPSSCSLLPSRRHAQNSHHTASNAGAASPLLQPLPPWRPPWLPPPKPPPSPSSPSPSPFPRSFNSGRGRLRGELHTNSFFFVG
jgi:hypothetical protein